MIFAESDRIPWSAYVIALGSLFTVLSQFMPSMTVLFTLIWISFLVYGGIKHRKSIFFGRMSVAFLAIYVIFGIYCFVCFFVTGVTGYVTGFFQLLSKSLLMYLVGIVTYSSIENASASIRFILRFYCVCAFVYSAWALANYFPGFGAWMSSMEYLFASKNSLGQICGVGSLILICLALDKGDSCFRVAQLIGGFALLIVALLFQCRTSVLGVALGVLFLMVIKKKRIALVVILCLAVFCVCLSPSLQSMLEHAFRLDRVSTGGDLSSGRLDYWADALVTLREHEIFGIGSFYVDNMYINLLVNVGVIGSVIVLAIWFSRLCINFARSMRGGVSSNRQKWLTELVASLSVFYIVESLLEGYPPFGPGACSFMFWMLCGYVDAFFASSGRDGDIRWAR